MNSVARKKSWHFSFEPKKYKSIRLYGKWLHFCNNVSWRRHFSGTTSIFKANTYHDGVDMKNNNVICLNCRSRVRDFNDPFRSKWTVDCLGWLPCQREVRGHIHGTLSVQPQWTVDLVKRFIYEPATPIRNFNELLSCQACYFIFQHATFFIIVNYLSTNLEILQIYILKSI